MKRSRTIWSLAAVIAVVLVASWFLWSGGRGQDSAPCDSGSSEARQKCYTGLLTERLQSRGLAAAVALLDELSTRSAYVADHAHELAHGVGIAAYTYNPNIVEAFVSCGDGSASGCRHGFVQAYLESRRDITAAELQELCRPLDAPAYSRALLFQCIHGMGHGLTMFRGHDLFAPLKDCDLLATDWDRTSCYGGVFMEVFVNATSPHHPATQLTQHSHHAVSTFRAIDPKDPLYPCSIVAQQYLYSCYQIQTSVILHLNGGNIGATARACDRAPADMRASCYESLGRDITAYAGRDPQKTADMCNQGTPAYAASCFAGAAKSLVNWTATTGGAHELCRIAAASASMTRYADACFRGLGEAIATMTVDAPAREELCLRAKASPAIAACRRGAGLGA
jgi:hypothetical protein